MAMTETELLDAVIDLCRLRHVKVAHFRPAQTGRGWRTPVQGDGAGFPDLVIAGPGGVLFRELKSPTGRLTADQLGWLGSLTTAGSDAGVWRPTDLATTVIDDINRIAKPITDLGRST